MGHLGGKINVFLFKGEIFLVKRDKQPNYVGAIYMAIYCLS